MKFQMEKTSVLKAAINDDALEIACRCHKNLISLNL